MKNLLVCSEASFEDTDPDGIPTHRHLAPGGMVAWDNCCKDQGQLYVRLVSMFPSGRPFPTEFAGIMRCGAYLMAATLAVGTVRCAHVVDDRGRAPTAEQMTGDALRLTLDAAILEQGIRCCLGANENVPWSMGEMVTSGPEGGCGSVEWLVTVGFNTCACPDHEWPEV